VLTNPTNLGVLFDDCTATSTPTQTMPSPGTSIGSVGGAATEGYLYFSSQNIIAGAAAAAPADYTSKGSTYSFTCGSSCAFATVAKDGATTCTVSNLGSMSAVAADPKLQGGDYSEDSKVPVDPRPACNGPAYENVGSATDGFFDTVTYKGAFGATNWLDGWSIMNTPLHPGFVSSSYTCPNQGTSPPLSLCGDVSSDTTWYFGPIYVLACQVHVKAGATLSIQAGVTIYATPEGEAPRLPARTRLG
jgi:hypothetical protein